MFIDIVFSLVCILFKLILKATYQMQSLNIPEIIGVEKIIKIAAAQEAGSLKVHILKNCFLYFYSQLYLANFDWKNSLTKSPPSTYQITDIFSVTGTSLLNHTMALQRPVNLLIRNIF